MIQTPKCPPADAAERAVADASASSASETLFPSVHLLYRKIRASATVEQHRHPSYSSPRSQTRKVAKLSRHTSCLSSRVRMLCPHAWAQSGHTPAGGPCHMTEPPAHSIEDSPNSSPCPPYSMCCALCCGLGLERGVLLLETRAMMSNHQLTQIQPHASLHANLYGCMDCLLLQTWSGTRRAPAGDPRRDVTPPAHPDERSLESCVVVP